MLNVFGDCFDYCEFVNDCWKVFFEDCLFENEIYEFYWFYNGICGFVFDGVGCGVCLGNWVCLWYSVDFGRVVFVLLWGRWIGIWVVVWFLFIFIVRRWFGFCCNFVGLIW